MKSLNSRAAGSRLASRFALLVATLAGLAATTSPHAQTFSDPGFTSEAVVSLPPFTPVGITWASDGRMFVWQKNGIVRIVKNGVLLPTPFINISSQVNQFLDRGMLGLALHPNFAENGYVYLLFTREEGSDTSDPGPKVSRLIRVTADPQNPDVALPNSAVIILGSIGTPPCSAQPVGADCIPSDSNTHSIGTVRFGRDGKLYVGNGDGASAGGVDPLAFRSQDLMQPSGKILRINDDGTAPGDNPFDDGTNSWRSKVWAYGLRNPYRWTLHPTRDEILIGDVGWNTWEELDRGLRGKNYGWPCFEGFLPTPEYQAGLPACVTVPQSSVTMPLVAWAHDDASPSLPGYDPNFLGDTAIGGTVYTGGTYPQLYQGNLFYGEYTLGWIRRLLFDASGNMTGNQLFASNVNGLVSIEQGPDGLLYYVDFPAGQVKRIKFNGPVAKITAAPTSGPSPLNVSFSSASSINPVGGSLTYAWNFGDGGTSTAANPSHVYTTAGVQTYLARLTVTASNGQNSSATISITAGSTAPTATITAPSDGATLLPGQAVAYQGIGTDIDDGPLPASALSWDVLLHHNDHIHLLQSGVGASGQFVTQYHGVGTYSYEIRLTATDSSGLTDTKSVNLPVLQDTTPPSAPGVLAATSAGPTKVDLIWNPATDNAAVTSYRIERCQAAGCSNFVQVATSAVSSFTDTNLTASTTYNYRVRAADATGNAGLYSNVATATTQPPSLGPVAAYSFDENTGASLADSSGNNNAGSILGPTWTAGKFGSALTFNGTSDLVMINHSSSLNLTTAMTLEAWVFPTSSAGGWHAIMQKEVDAYFLHSSGAGAALDPTAGGTFNGTVSYFAASHPMTVNAWNHVAVTWDGATMRLYVNGVAGDTMARSGTLQSSAAALRIGGNLPYGEFFQGRIDEVRIYARALSAAEIQTDMNTPVGPAGPDSTPPSTPSGLAANAAGSTQVDLSWTASTDNVGVAGYLVERCQGAGCSIYTQIATPNGNSYSDTSLAASTSYSYRVRARDAAGNTSGYSNIATVTTPVFDPTPPTAPSALVASAISATQINLSWTASTDNIGVSGYRVERCQGAGCSTFAQVATPSSPSYSDTSLAASTSYSYRVRAVDASGNLSSFSNVASATTAAPSLGAVAAYSFDEGTGTTAADASGNGNVGTLTNGPTWTTAGKYGKALSFDGSNDLVLVNHSASLNLTNGMTLEAWVFPTSSAGGWHAIMQKEVDAYFLHASGGGPPLDPTGGGTFSGQLSYFAAGIPMTLNAWNHVAVTWDGSIMRSYVNGVAGATQARNGTLQSTTTPLRIGGNSPYAEMFQGRIDEVRIYNRALTQTEVLSDMNSPITPVGPDTTPPSNPTGLAATAANATQVNVSWTASTDNVGVTGYLLERCQNAGCSSFTQIATPTGTSHSDTTVSASTSYTYRVRAIDSAGNTSGYSATASATTPTPDVTPPSAPSGLTATATSTTQINLGWTAATDNVGVTGYQIERCQGAGCSSFALVTTVSVTSFSNTGLTASTSYSYRVRALDAAGNTSAYSNVGTATTQTPPDTTVPTTPTGLTATAASSSQINLSWTASTDNVGVTGYQVFRCQGASCSNFALLTTVPPSTTFSDTGLAVSTAYRYRLRATDAAGNLSANSAIATATTLSGPPDTTLPTAPASLTATATSSSQINLSWAASTDNVGVTGYRVERCQGSGCSTFSQIATPTTTTYSDSTGLAASTSYSYRVRATDAAGNLSGYSPIATATTQAASLGPVIAYAFNEGTGTTASDASGNGVTGTLTNGPTWIAGKYGTAVSFDGNDDKVALPSSFDVSALPFTLEAWIRPTNFNPWHAIFSKRSSYSAAGMRFDVGLATSSGQVYLTTFSSTVTFNYSPPLNAWTHIAVVATSTGTSLYVNGALQQSLGAVTLGTGANAAVNIGRTGDNDDPYAGGIDDLRLYKRSLTLVEIQNDMNTPVTP